MSLRANYELTVTADRPIPRAKIEQLIHSTPYNDTHIYFDGEEPDDTRHDSWVTVDKDCKSFVAVLSDIHPEEFADPLTKLSLDLPDTRFEVEEYVKEATEMVEAGRETYWLKGGNRYPNGSCRDPDQPVLAFEVLQADGFTIRYEILIAGPGEHIRCAYNPKHHWSENSLVVRQHGHGLRETEYDLHDAGTWGWIGRLIASRDLNIKQLTPSDEGLWHTKKNEAETTPPTSI